MWETLWGCIDTYWSSGQKRETNWNPYVENPASDKQCRCLLKVPHPMLYHQDWPSLHRWAWNRNILPTIAAVWVDENNPWHHSDQCGCSWLATHPPRPVPGRACSDNWHSVRLNPSLEQSDKVLESHICRPCINDEPNTLLVAFVHKKLKDPITPHDNFLQ